MSGATEASVKICRVCGRTIEWRRKWAKDWASVRYCSQACRRRGLRDSDRQLEALIREQLAARARGATICPSEVARAYAPGAWRDWMEAVRCAARRLAAEGTIEITQQGRRIDPDHAKGPIRLRQSR